MSKQHIEELLQTALENLHKAGKLSVDIPRLQIDQTKDKEHGDYAANIALVLAKLAKRKPREVAEMIVSAMPASAHIAKIEIAGPGFINFFLSSQALYSVIPDILTAGEQYGRINLGKDKRVIVEFVSKNPTGPLHVGHGRQAAYGAIVSDLLEAIGYKVHREYYINDAGRQMDILAVSVWLRYLEVSGEKFIFPANVYQGEYVIDIAKKILEKHGKKLVKSAKDIFYKLPLDEAEGGDKEIFIDAVIVRAKEILGAKDYMIIFEFSLKMILADIRDDLAEFGVQFQLWFSERQFTETNAVDHNIEELKKIGLIYQREGAMWFRSTDFGDDKDRVMQRTNGERTYFANDFAYHVNKFERGFEYAIDVFGADHHGYIPRMKAGLKARSIAPDKLTYLMIQMVTLYRGNQQIPMSTRSGSFVTFRELRTEVGNDAARFFYVMRKCEQPIDFDLDLAKSKSNENPVYYIQYAYARICSVFRQLAEKNMTYNQTEGLANLVLLTQAQELELLAALSRYQQIIMNAATQHEPHLLTTYLRELANYFHTYYNSHQFLVEEAALRNARLTLIIATRQILANALKLLGISTPDSM